MSYSYRMFISPSEQDVPTPLSAKLRTLPALIEVYLLLVDRVMREHGFDPEKGEFLTEKSIFTIDGSNDDLTQTSAVWRSETAELIPLVAA